MQARLFQAEALRLDVGKRVNMAGGNRPDHARSERGAY